MLPTVCGQIWSNNGLLLFPGFIWLWIWLIWVLCSFCHYYKLWGAFFCMFLNTLHFCKFSQYNLWRSLSPVSHRQNIRDKYFFKCSITFILFKLLMFRLLLQISNTLIMFIILEDLRTLSMSMLHSRDAVLGMVLILPLLQNMSRGVVLWSHLTTWLL